MDGTAAAQVLGPVRIRGAAGTAVELPGMLPRRLVVALALAGRAGRSVDGLVEDVWADEPPRNPRAALQMLVSRVRAVAVEGALSSTPTGYALAGSDLDVAERVAESLPADPASARDSAAGALACWTGTPGADLGSPDLADALLTRAERVEQRLRRARGEALLDLGEAAGALEDLDRLAETHPYDSGVQRMRMEALAASGRVSDALAIFAAFRERLADELGADPDAELVALNARLLQPARTGSATGLRAATTPLLGRERDLVRLVDLMGRHRLVSVVGPGGLGKTRLAHETGRRLLARFERVVFVELAGARAGEDVPLVLGAAVGVREQAGRRIRDAVGAPVLAARTRDALAARPTLLILDNCEHVIAAAAAEVAELLAVVPSLAVLTTTRVPLMIAGEQAVPLAPLDADTDGARLFVERALAVRPGADLDPDLVARLCRRLDGLPLAIELAAARIRSLSLPQLTERLDDRFAVLVGGDRTAPERHRTLFAVIDWSWQLLDPAARRALRRLAVLPDGFTAATADRVLGGADGALDELVDQSLLSVEERPNGDMRFRMLETVREFGLLALDRDGDQADADAAVDAWAVHLADATRPGLLTGADFTAVGVLTEEEETLLAVLRRPVAGREAVVVAMFALLTEWWLYRGEFEAVGQHAAPIFEALRHWRPGAADRDAALAGLTSLAIVLSLTAQPFGSRAIALLQRTLAGVPESSDGLWPTFARLALQARSPDGLSAALDGAVASPHPPTAAMALITRAQLAENAGDLDASMRDLTRVFAIADREGLEWYRASAGLALVQLHTERAERRAALIWAAGARERLTAMRAGNDVRQLDWLIAVNEIGTGALDAAESRIRGFVDAPASEFGAAGDVRSLALCGLAEIESIRGNAPAAERLWMQAQVETERRSRAVPLAVMTASAAIAGAAQLPRSSEALTTAALAWRQRLRTTLLVLARQDRPTIDAPVYGGGLLGLAAWLLHRTAGTDGHRAGVELAALGAVLNARIDLPTLERVATLAAASGGPAYEQIRAGTDRADAVPRAVELLQALRFS